MSLDPRAASLLAMLHRIDAPQLAQLPLDVARHNFQKLMFAYREPPEAVLAVEKLVIPRREIAGGPVLARLYRPLTTGAAEAPEALPVLLWLHGGGWMLGDLASYDSLCRALANAAQCAVLAVDYRLAPEHPFPAGLDDAWWALRWLRSATHSMGLDADRIAIGGDSAGGNLAAVLAYFARDAELPLCLQYLAYPAMDQLSESASMRLYGERHFLDRASLRWFRQNYLSNEADALDWRASPLLAPDCYGLAPALIQTAECDPLTDDAAAYAQRLLAFDGALNYRQYAGMVHGFLTMGKLFPQARQAIDEAAAALRLAFSLAQTSPAEFAALPHCQ